MYQQEMAYKAEAIEKCPWLLIVALSLITFIINVDYTAVNLAMSPIAMDFHSSLNTVQWILSSYALACAVLVIPAGGLTTKYSKKSLCLFGLGLFMLGSFFAAISASTTQLIMARILQGVAGAIYMPAVYAILFLNVAENFRGRAMGIISLGVGLGLAVGPFIGGALITMFDWRSIFWINLPIGAVALAVISMNAHHETLSASTSSVHKTSACLIGISLTLLLYTLNQWHWWAQEPVLYLLLAFISIISFIGFVILQQKLATPLIPLDLFLNFSYSGCGIGMLIEQYCFSSMIIILGLYLQKVQHFSAFQSSLIFLFLTIIFGMIATFGGAWVDRKGIRAPILTGLVMMALSALLFSQLSAQTPMSMLCLVLVMTGTGLGFAFIGLNTGVIKTVQQQQVGIATSVFMMMALLGNAFGVAFTVLLFEAFSQASLIDLLKDHLVNATQLQTLFDYLADKISLERTDLFMDHVDHAVNIGINRVMLINAMLCVFAVLCCRQLFKKESPKT